ncbi:MAG: ABC transporter permease [Egibacteraceae bacterium]
MAVAQAPHYAADRPVALGQGLGRYLAMPAFLAAVLVALYLYVRFRELDSIEAESLNASFIVDSVLRHLFLVGVSTCFVIVLAVPLGILLTRPFARFVSPPIVTVANTGQAIPSFGVIVMLALGFGLGVLYAIIALVIYAFLPVLRNTMVGLRQVDPALIEAGRGMGMTKLSVLAHIELPLAVPVVLAGVRMALVVNMGTATVAAYTAAGGLGEIIVRGLVLGRPVVKVTGAALTAVLALAVDYVAGIAEDVLRPRGL